MQIDDLQAQIDNMQNRAHAAETALLETQEELKKQRRSACVESDEHAQVLNRVDEYRDKLKAAQLKCERLENANRELELRVTSVENLRELSKESWEAVSAERDSLAAELSSARDELDKLRTAAASAQVALANEEQERRTLEHALEQATSLAEAAVAQVEEEKRRRMDYEESGASRGVLDGEAGEECEGGGERSDVLPSGGVSGGAPAVAAASVGGDKLEVRLRKRSGCGARRCLVPVVAVTFFLAIATSLQHAILAGGGGDARMVPT
jgi:hypothetical protein